MACICQSPGLIKFLTEPKSWLNHGFGICRFWQHIKFFPLTKQIKIIKKNAQLGSKAYLCHKDLFYGLDKDRNDSNYTCSIQPAMISYWSIWGRIPYDLHEVTLHKNRLLIQPLSMLFCTFRKVWFSRGVAIEANQKYLHS